MASANSSTTDVSISNADVDILDKIESQHPGEYSPAPSRSNSRAPSIIDNLEKGKTEAKGPQPITHRPTGVKARFRDFPVTDFLVVFDHCLHFGRSFPLRLGQHHRR